MYVPIYSLIPLLQLRFVLIIVRLPVFLLGYI